MKNQDIEKRYVLRAIFMALFLSMVLVLSGCGEKGAPPETQGESSVVDPDTPTDPSDPSDPSNVSGSEALVQSISLLSGSESIVADGSTNTVIRATVMDTNGDPAAGITVTFTATLGTLNGTVPYTVVTDARGTAEITLQSATTVGTSSITAMASGFSQAKLVTFISGPPTTVALVAAPSTVAPKGTSRLMATITDAKGNPVKGETIRFDISTNNSGADLSLLEAPTNVNGRAEVEYTAGIGTGIDTVTATTQNAQSGTIGITVNSTAVVVKTVAVTSGADSLITGTSTTIRAMIEDIHGDPARGASVVFTATSGTLGVNPVTDENGITEVLLTSTHNVGSSIVTATAGGVSGGTTIRFMAGPSDHMDIQASPVDVALGGQSTLVVIVYDEYDNCVPLTTVQLGFTASGSGAPSLASAIGQTDDSGRFTTLYTAGTTTGIDTIHVRSGDASGDVDISVDPSNSTIGSLILTAGALELVVGSGGSVGLRATVFDLDGDSVEGVPVLFTPGVAVVTNSEGIAESFYPVPTTSGDVNVMASVGGLFKVAILSFVSGPADGNQSSITATPSTVPADGTSEVVVQVLLKDSNDNLVANGTEVTLISTAGTITSVNPAKTVSGRVDFTLRAPESRSAADLTIQEVASTPLSVVTFGVSSTGHPASISLHTGDSQIYVAGVGQIETTTISVKVLNSAGELIDESNYAPENQSKDNVRIHFETRPNGGEYVSGTDWKGVVVDTNTSDPMTVKTTNGSITLGLQAGILPGIVDIFVEALLDESGDELLSSVGASLPQVSIASGPPHSITFSHSNLNAVIDLNNPANVGTEDGEEQTIPGIYRRSGSLSVTDRYGNDVPDDTTVNLGLIDSVISMGVNGEIVKNDDTLTDTVTSASFDTAFITRNFPERRIEANDRMLLLNADPEDKSRMVAGPISISSTDIDAHAAYNLDKTGLHYVIGSNLLGAYISGTTPDGTKIKGTSVVQNGLAKFWVTYPADAAHILTGCYGYVDSSPLSYSSLDIRRNKPKSAQVYVVASAGNDLTAIDQGNFGFASIAGWTLKSSIDEISSTTLIEFELRDGGDTVLLPFVAIGNSVLITKNVGGMTVDIPGTLRTDINGRVIVPVTVAAGVKGDAATITFGAGDARATVEVVIP